jgi:hypothetical protein
MSKIVQIYNQTLANGRAATYTATYPLKRYLKSKTTNRFYVKLTFATVLNTVLPGGTYNKLTLIAPNLTSRNNIIINSTQSSSQFDLITLWANSTITGTRADSPVVWECDEIPQEITISGLTFADTLIGSGNFYWHINLTIVEVEV